MSVGCPGIGTFGTCHQVTESRRGGSPEPECAVDVEPRAGSGREVGNLIERIERSRVDVSGLRTHDRRPRGVGERVGKRPGNETSLLVGSNRLDLPRPDAEKAESTVDRDVSLLADENADARSAPEAVIREIPAGGREDVVPSRRRGP